jgi:hypothetical protein
MNILRRHTLCALASVVAALFGCTTIEPTCVRNSDCASGLECRLGVCRTAMPAGADAGQSDAGIPPCEVPGKCVRGEPCRVSADCIDQACVGGICCDNKCESPCASCRLPGFVGRCTPKPKGTPCSDAYVCDGTQLSCPSNCTNVKDCAAASTCCTAELNTKYSGCVDNGMLNKCIELPACTTITDTFSGTNLDETKWLTGGRDLPDAGGGYAITVSNGKVGLSLNHPVGFKDAYAAFALKKHVSLSNSSCMIEVGDVSLPGEPGDTAQSGLLLLPSIDNGEYIFFRVLNDSRLTASETIPGRPDVLVVSKAPIPAAARRFLRLRDEGGTLVFEYSGNGKTFTTHTTIQPTMRMSNLFVNVITSKDEIRRDAGYTVLYDNFNVVP